MTSFFDALAANLQEAGYEVEMYSQEFVPRILNRLGNNAWRRIAAIVPRAPAISF
jgi:hypothetical protein